METGKPSIIPTAKDINVGCHENKPETRNKMFGKRHNSRSNILGGPSVINYGGLRIKQIFERLYTTWFNLHPPQTGYRTIVLVDGELATVTVAASGLNANDVIVQHYNLGRTHPWSPSPQFTVNKYDQ